MSVDEEELVDRSLLWFLNMKQIRECEFFGLLLAMMLTTLTARAEGTAQLNTTQALRAGTQMYVDILDPDVEQIAWEGVGTVTVTNPQGVTLATLSSGESVSLAGGEVGAYGVLVNQGQVVGVAWDLEVENATTTGGRLHSYDWKFNAGSFAVSRATYASFYAMIPGGVDGETAVIELKLDGLAGYVYNINANRIGVNGPNGGRSVSMYGHTLTPEFPIYLQPPAVASYSRVNPEVFGLDYIGGVSQAVTGDSITPCNQIVPGESFGRFQFYTTTEGTFHLQCDLNKDGAFDVNDSDDFLKVGTTTAGVNTILWDGTHNGSVVELGDYQCRIRVNVGEFHYVGSDIETSYQGMRMYEVASDGNRAPLTMFWNDEAVQEFAQTMPNGEVGLVSPGSDGMSSGAFVDEAEANVNARSWGDFNSGGKGNMNFLDTFVWLDSSESATITLAAVDGSTDSDGDGLGDFAESCYYGTDPDDSDSDGDGVDDGTQYGSESSGGNVGGLESNGSMASQLARRAIQRTRMTTNTVSRALRQGTLVRTALSDVTLPGLDAVEVSPADLTELTNAEDVLAIDYTDDNGKKVATLFAVQTEGDLYEHSKSLCDRAGGSRLLSVGLDQQTKAFSAVYQHRDNQTLDHAVTFKLYQVDDDLYRFEGRWLRDDYSLPEEGQKVINLQLWANTSSHVHILAQGVADKLGIAGLLTDENANSVLDEELLTSSPLQAPPVEVPSVVVAEASNLSSNSHLALMRISGSTESPIRLRISANDESGKPLPERWVEAVKEVEQALNVDTGLTTDMMVDVFDGDRHVDRVWLTDGAWAQFDDALWGGSTEVAHFSTEDCSRDGEVEHPEGTRFSGCAEVTAQRVDSFAGVARHFARPLSLQNRGSIQVFMKGESAVEVCFERDGVTERRCEQVQANPEGEYVTVNVPSGLGAVDVLTFTMDEPGTLRVGALQVLAGSSDTGGGCNASNSSPVRALWIVLLLALLLMIRSRATITEAVMSSKRPPRR